MTKSPKPKSPSRNPRGARFAERGTPKPRGATTTTTTTTETASIREIEDLCIYTVAASETANIEACPKPRGESKNSVVNPNAVDNAAQPRQGGVHRAS